MVQRAIRLVEGKIRRGGSAWPPSPEVEEAVESLLRQHKSLLELWEDEMLARTLECSTRLRIDEQGRLVAEKISLARIEGLQEQIKELKSELREARSKLSRSLRGWRSLFTALPPREALEAEVAALEADLSSSVDRLEKVVLEEIVESERDWYRISIDPEDAGLTADIFATGFGAYMTPSVLEKAQAFQKEEPLYLGAWFPKRSEEGEGKFWWHRDKFWISTGYSEEEARLLIWEKGRREEKKLERLAKAMTASQEAREEAGRERIPEEVRLLVWERDGGRCVKCGSAEDLEYDHIIPISKGGSNTEKNVQLLCAKCNQEKGDRIA